VYGDRRGEILSEDCTFPSPISYYGASKLGSEALIQAFAYMNDMSVLIFRISNAIGPHMTHGVIRDFIRKLSYDNHTLEILGDGNQEKPFIYIQDLMDAILQFMDVPKGVSIFNVASEGVTTIKKVADIICEEMGLNNVKYSFTGGEGGWKGDVPRFIYNVDKINAAGWKAKYNSDEAVRMAVSDILKQESVNYSG
jgi:UDP-glucose 4-epimerase